MMIASTPHLAVRRPMLFSVVSTLALVAAVVLLAIVQRMMTTPLLQEAVGAAGRVAIGAVAFIGLVRYGWGSWIAATASQTSWRLMLVPLVYVLLLYPLLFSGTYRMPPKNGLLLSMVAANGFVAVLHGATNAFIHANRYGRDPATDLSTALLLALAPVPLLGYSWWLIGRFRQLRPRPLAR